MPTATKARVAKPVAKKLGAKPVPKKLPPKPVPAPTKDLFRDALLRVLLHEGGRVDHPKDPGGRTNKGITQRVYSAWRQRQSLPVRDVFMIGDMEVEAIYRFQYWQPIHGDALPAGVGYVVMDGAVNSGPKQSAKWLQRALGVGVDGDIGNVTLQAVKAHLDHDQLVKDICTRRMIFLQALKTWKTFGKGWTRRVEDVLAIGQAWATGSVAPLPEFRPGGETKAEVTDAKEAPPRAPGDLATGVGSAGAGGGLSIGGVLDNAKAQLEPYAGSFAFVGNIVVWLVIAGIGLAAAGFLYRLWAQRKKAKLDDALDRIEVAK